MQLPHSSPRPHPSSLPRAFTLVELLVVIAIISILVGITIPIVGKVRKVAQESATRSLLTQIESACQAYFTDFSAYPGPFSYGVMVQQNQSFGAGGDELFGDVNFTTEITDGNVTPGPTGFAPDVKRLTGSENLVLGLMGGLESNNPNDPSQTKYRYNKDSLGLGAIRFNPKRPGRANAYFQSDNGQGSNRHLSLRDPSDPNSGHFYDDAGAAKDTVIPEFIDSFANPLPILYMRARKGGAANNPAAISDTDNNVVTDQAGTPGQTAQYNLLEIAAYTQSDIGVGRDLKPADYKDRQGPTPHGLISVDPAQRLVKRSAATRYPYDAYAYLTDPASDDSSLNNNPRLQKHRARKADQYILISAGADRVYGTEDDITNFGSVLP